MFGHRSMQRRLVWIFGSPRSGSTWLLRILGEHDRVVPINEPQIGLHLAPFLSDWPGWQPAIDDEAATFNRLAGGAQAYFFAKQHESVWLPELRRLICRRLAVYSRPRSLVVLKEPNGSQAADIIMRALPRSRLLFLLRDGRDVVDSELAASLRGSWLDRNFVGFRGIEESERAEFVIQAAHKWVWRTRVVEEAYDAHDGPKLLVRYENLRSNPRDEVRRILRWLGLAAVEGQLSTALEKHDFRRTLERGQTEFVRSASPGSWRKNLTDDEKESIQTIMLPKLRQLAYEPQ